MKKVVILFLGIFLCLTGYAQVERFQTIFYSTAEWDKQAKDYNWSDWEKTEGIPVVVDTDKRTIKIFSEHPQDYAIYHQLNEGNDGKGNFKDYAAVDQEGLKCIIKTRVQHEESIMQICIYYDDIAWAYCVTSKESEKQ